MNTHDTCGHPRVLSDDGVAALLDISTRHLSNIRKNDPSFPEPCWLGTLPRWHSDAILSYVLAANMKGKTRVGADGAPEVNKIIDAPAIQPRDAGKAAKAKSKGSKKRSSTDV